MVKSVKSKSSCYGVILFLVTASSLSMTNCSFANKKATVCTFMSQLKYAQFIFLLAKRHLSFRLKKNTDATHWKKQQPLT